MNQKNILVTFVVVLAHIAAFFALQQSQWRQVDKALLDRNQPVMVVEMIALQNPSPNVPLPLVNSPKVVVEPNNPKVAKPVEALKPVAIGNDAPRVTTPSEVKTESPIAITAPAASSSLNTQSMSSEKTPSSAAPSTTESNAQASVPPAPDYVPGPPKAVSLSQVQCSTPQPDYPAMAKRMREEGIAKIKLFINENGRVDSVELVSSSDSERLDQNALNAAKLTVCKPYIEGNKILRVTAVRPFHFKID